MIHFDISIKQFMVKPVLWLTKFFNDNKVVLVCKGYDEDWDFYTGLYWGEDKDCVFSEYDDYRIWLDF